MNAADVLRQVGNDDGSAVALSPKDADQFVAALLAHGEQGQGVTIEADGDLHPKDPPMTTRLPDGTLWALAEVTPKLTQEQRTRIRIMEPSYRLLPISAEAGDIDGPTRDVSFTPPTDRPGNW